MLTTSETNTWKRAIRDAIAMIDWEAAPLLKLLGVNGEGKFNLVNWPSTKVEWIEDAMAPLTSLLTEEVDTSETGIDVTTGTGVYFRQGDIVLINSVEKVLVTSVATDTLTVVRGYGDTSGTSASTGQVVEIIGRAMPEGATATTGYITDPTLPYNYTQIISQAVSSSRSNQELMRYGIKDPLMDQMAKLINSNGGAGLLAQMLEKTFYYGERVARGADPAYGTMGGFKTFVTTNVTNKATAALDKADIHKLIRDIRGYGGRVTHIVGGEWGMEKISQLYEGNVVREESQTTGGIAIDKIRTPHGLVSLVYDWMCPDSELYFINAERCGWVTFSPFQPYDIARTGDAIKKDIVGEYSFVLLNQKSHGYIYGMSTTA